MSPPRRGLAILAAALSLAAMPASLAAQAGVPLQLPKAVAASLYPGALAATIEEDPLAAERRAIRAAVGRTRWREGALLGAVVFGAAGAYVAGGFCGADDSATGAAVDGCTEEIIGGALLGAAAGGLIGGLIGSRIHKGSSAGD